MTISASDLLGCEVSAEVEAFIMAGKSGSIVLKVSNGTVMGADIPVNVQNRRTALAAK